MATLTTRMETQRYGDTLLAFGEIVTSAADTVLIQLPIPDGWTVQLVSMTVWHDNGSSRTWSLYVGGKDILGNTTMTRYGGGMNTWEIAHYSVATSSSTSCDLSTIPAGVILGSETVIEGASSSTVGAKTFRQWMTFRILEVKGGGTEEK